MKRISSLLLAAAMAFGAAGAADAAELKVSGVMDFAFGAARTDIKEDNRDGEEYFRAEQRFRPQLNFVASESLQAVMQLEIGTTAFGRAEGNYRGGQIDQRDNNIEVKRLYLDWIIPTTEVTVRMGKQPLALPSATGFGNPVFDSDVAGIVASGQINDMVGLTGFWVRPYDDDQKSNALADEVDAFGVVVPVKGEGWSVSPWGMYASVGSDSGYLNAMREFANTGPALLVEGPKSDERIGVWWIGFGADYQIMDNLKFSMDAMYGASGDIDLVVSNNGPAGGDPFNNAGDVDTSGYFIDAALSYDIENIGTASLLGWYASGNDGDDDDFDQIPILGSNGGFHPTSFGAPGSVGIGVDGALFNSGIGTWGLGVELADVTFVEDLSHTFRVAYIQGTNSRGGMTKSHISDLAVYDEALYLTTHDSAWEFNFDSKYQIYENLAAFVELGYIAMDIDDSSNKGFTDADDLWKAQVLFQYKF